MPVLQPEEYREIRVDVLETVVPELMARRTMPTRSVPVGRQEYGWDKWAELRDAAIISKFDTGMFDIMEKTRTPVSIPILHKGFYMSRIDLESSRLYGEALRVVGARLAARKIAELEDNVVFNGDTTFGIDGYIPIAGNEHPAVYEWSEGAGIPYGDIAAALALNEADGFGAKFLVLEPGNLAETREFISGTGITQLEKIRELVPNILVSHTIPHGTALLCDSSPDIAELVLAENFVILDPNDPAQKVYEFDVLTRSVPVFYQPKAICKITGI